MSRSIIWEYLSTLGVLCLPFSENHVTQKDTCLINLFVLKYPPNILVATNLCFGRMVNKTLYWHANNPRKILCHSNQHGKIHNEKKHLFTFKFYNYPRNRPVASYLKKMCSSA